MESIIGLRTANCRDCYKCIRSCPLKTIAYKDGQVRIMDSGCIYCGSCLLVCPQNAKYINSDLAKVKGAIAAGEKLYVSLAPSYIAAFPQARIVSISAALKKLGFAHVEETAIGAAAVTREYGRIITAHKMKNIIATSCPAVNLLVEKHYPELLDQLAPVVTPAVAHARMIRQIYGPRAKVVFIGPCVAKKSECSDPENRKAIFAVLTFVELKNWMEEQGVDFSGEDAEAKSLRDNMARFYPAPGGIIRNLTREERRVYETLSVDGVDRCMEVLDSIQERGFSGYFLELDACPGGCLGGPVLKMMNTTFLNSKNELVRNVKRISEAPPALTDGAKVKLSRSFKDLSIKEEPFREEQIREVLALTGKTSPDKELNCGCCGYGSCREKAIAVLQNKADIRMCVPYMKSLAESMSNTVIENIPIGVMTLNGRLEMEYINPFARKLLKIKGDFKGKSVYSVLKSDDFIAVQSSGENILNHKQSYEDLKITVEQSVVFVKDSGTIFVLLKDITGEESLRESQRRSTEETAAFAKNVINKQIRVVQEIASLLGETTTETQSAFSKLAESALPDAGEKHEF